MCKICGEETIRFLEKKVADLQTLLVEEKQRVKALTVRIMYLEDGKSDSYPGSP